MKGQSAVIEGVSLRIEPATISENFREIVSKGLTLMREDFFPLPGQSPTLQPIDR